MLRVRIFPLMLLICGIANGCKPLPNVQGKGVEFLQGIWAQDSVPDAGKLLSYTQYKFKFTCDSFYVDLVTHSKVNYYEESCFNNGIWKEYAKGVYRVKNDTLLLLGTYTKANYKQKISGCYTIGQYIKSFKLLSKATDSLRIESTENQREIALALKQRISCVPQPL